MALLRHPLGGKPLDPPSIDTPFPHAATRRRSDQNPTDSHKRRTHTRTRSYTFAALVFFAAPPRRCARYGSPSFHDPPRWHAGEPPPLISVSGTGPRTNQPTVSSTPRTPLNARAHCPGVGRRTEGQKNMPGHPWVTRHAGLFKDRSSHAAMHERPPQATPKINGAASTSAVADGLRYRFHW